MALIKEKKKAEKEREMAGKSIEKMASIDAQLRLLAPRKVSEDDKLVEYDALLLDRFLDILQDLHGDDIRETVLLLFHSFSCRLYLHVHYTFTRASISVSFVYYLLKLVV